MLSPWLPLYPSRSLISWRCADTACSAAPNRSLRSSVGWFVIDNLPPPSPSRELPSSRPWGNPISHNHPIAGQLVAHHPLSPLVAGPSGACCPRCIQYSSNSRESQTTVPAIEGLGSERGYDLRAYHAGGRGNQGAGRGQTLTTTMLSKACQYAPGRTHPRAGVEGGEVQRLRCVRPGARTQCDALTRAGRSAAARADQRSRASPSTSTGAARAPHHTAWSRLQQRPAAVFAPIYLHTTLNHRSEGSAGWNGG